MPSAPVNRVFEMVYSPLDCIPVKTPEVRNPTTIPCLDLLGMPFLDESRCRYPRCHIPGCSHVSCVPVSASQRSLCWLEVPFYRRWRCQPISGSVLG